MRASPRGAMLWIVRKITHNYMLSADKRKLDAKAYRKRNPAKVAARKAVFSAVRSCLLIKELCFCGEESEAHHPDYSKPLDVIWLCRKHHLEIHYN